MRIMPTARTRREATRIHWPTLTVPALTMGLLFPLMSPVAAGDPGAAASQKPNIVFILTDDLDFDEISVYDAESFPSYTGAWKAGKYEGPDQDSYHKDVHWMKQGERPYFPNPVQWTPHLERLAKEGMVFERFYTTTSVCTPSRYSMLTGRLASGNPALVSSTPTDEPLNVLWNSPLAPNEPNIAKEMKTLGYRTGFFGKWHNSVYRVGERRPYTEERTVFGVELKDDSRDPTVLQKIKAGYADAVTHLTRNIGFDKAGGLFTGNKDRIGLPLALQAHNLEWIASNALEFLREERKQPFCLYLWLTLPHRQNSAAENNEDPLASPAGWLLERPAGFPDRDSLKAQLIEQGGSLQNFASTWIDACVGAILDELDRLGLAQNTLVVFTSDHQSRGKNTCYEGSRSPMIMRWPGVISPGSKNPEICASTDLVPTLLDAAGSPSPTENTDGKSLLPMLRAESPARLHQSILLESGYSRAVVTKDWKYIANRPPPFVVAKMEADKERSRRGGTPRIVGWDGINNGEAKWGVWFGSSIDFPDYFDTDQLYNLGTDPFEQDNLAGDPKASDTLVEMKALLEAHLSSQSHPFGEFSRPHESP